MYFLKKLMIGEYRVFYKYKELVRKVEILNSKLLLNSVSKHSDILMPDFHEEVIRIYPKNLSCNVNYK